MEQILGWLSGVNFGEVLVGLISGAIFIKLFDEIILKIIVSYWPEKYLDMALNKVRDFDNKYLDVMKEKYPKAGQELEAKLSKFIEKIDDIILDRE